MIKVTPRWKRLVGWFVTPIFLFTFISTLVLFHGVHIVANLWGARLHRSTLNMMNRAILWLMRWIGGARISVTIPVMPNSDRPVLVVSNHQSMYDIPMIMLMFPNRFVGFVAKKELGKWIPSISLSLRRLGSVLIDRKDPKQAIPAIEGFGRETNEKRQVACLFPEGTRARDGVMKPFRRTGLEAMIRSMPDAIVMPVVIEGNWEFLRYNLLPVPFGVSISCRALDPIDPTTMPISQIVTDVEAKIRTALGQAKS